MLASRRLHITLWTLAWYQLLLLVPALAQTAKPCTVAVTCLHMGIDAYERPNYIEALTYLRRAIALEPTNVQAQFYLGLSLNRTGHFAEAIQWLEKAFLGDPSLPAIHYHLGLAYFQSGLYKEIVAQAQSETAYAQAVEHFRKAVAAAPAQARAQLYLGLSFSRIGKFQEAIPALEQALEHDPSLQRTHYHLGLAYFHTHRYAKALTHFQIAETFDDQKAATRLYQGAIYYWQKRYTEALQSLDEGIKLNPALTMVAQYYRGRVFYDMYELARDTPAQLARDTQAQEAFAASHDAAVTVIDNALKAAGAIAADPTDLKTATAATVHSTVVRNAQGYRYASQQYLDAIAQRARERQLVQLEGSIGFQYDDNVALESNDEVSDFGHKADGLTVFSFVGRLLPVRSPQWRLGVEYALFQSLHFDLDEFNLQSHTGRFFTSMQSPDVTWHMAAGYTLNLLDNKRFFDEMTLLPSAKIRLTDALSTVVSVRYRRSNFSNQPIPSGLENERDRDGWSLEVGFDQYLTFNNRRSFVRLSYYYEVSRSDGSDWEFDGQRVGLGLGMRLPWDVVLHVKGAYNRRNYLHRNSFDNTDSPQDWDKRLDNRLEGLVQLSREMWRAKAGYSLTLLIGYTHVSTLSNIDFFNYNRNVATVMLSGRY